ncbi:MAG: TonB-dependent receptor, partial [Kordiimonadaceae bacterium]|nr:TonB-dependent receptor [Kordiimonadaceae bacterium]
PIDPCDQNQIDALIAAGDARASNRAANCLADGLPAGFQDPLSARFAGAISGNPDLTEEESDSYTLGIVLRPRFIEGLTITVDYWNLEINNAIGNVSAQDIVDNCYDNSDFPNNQFCDSFERNSDTGSAQFGGFTFLRQQTVNFAKLEAAGYDFVATYTFNIEDHGFTLNVSGTKYDKVDRFFDPADLSLVDPELGEIARPEWSGNASIQWRYGAFSLGWSTLYQGEQTFSGVEIETATELYGEGNAIADEFFSHNLNFSWDMSENIRLYGGINNVTDEKPFFTENAYPISGRGRSFFLGMNFEF